MDSLVTLAIIRTECIADRKIFFLYIYRYMYKLVELHPTPPNILLRPHQSLLYLTLCLEKYPGKFGDAGFYRS